MRRTTIMLTDDLGRMADLECASAGISLTELVRRALAAYLEAKYAAPRELSIVGIGAGAGTEHDLSTRVDEMLVAGWTPETIAGRDS